MNQARMRLATVTVAPFLLALVVHLTVFLVLGDRLPDSLAGHFDLSGDADRAPISRTASLVGAVVLFTGIGALWAAGALGGALTARGVKGLTGGGWALSGLLGYALTATLYANLDATDSSAVHFPPWQLGVALAVALACAGAGLLLTRFVPDPGLEPTGDDDTARIDLADGELAGWSRRTGSGALLAVGLATLVGGVFVAGLVSWRYGPFVFVIGLLALVFASAHVSVDRHGLTVAMGALSWPRVRVPLNAIETASSRRINAVADYGGWGYRIRHKRSGVVLRSGEAIVVRRTNGREFAVTVADSATGAALLNTLVDRRKRG
ncbi:DUF1648 domain-containing protein [Streptomyces sp. NBC_00838]|uniref:DUF1648 domain-containing protein n=1 Tax=Streptomyces sp. NBC_00838 TaxID=2903680 RepID=UPI003867845C|nr:DUF1648 domain-containing protein [Streptomyces sp. NBC_00838]